MKQEFLKFTGYNGSPFTARLTRRGGRELAVLLPGLNYSTDMPLLSYSHMLMAEREADVLALDFAYNRKPKFRIAPQDERLAWIKEDGRIALDAALQFGPYARLTVIGKSLGTISMGWGLPDAAPENTRLAWLTPSLVGTGLPARIAASQYPSFCLIGTRDPACTPEMMDRLRGMENATLSIIEGADHGFTRPEGVAASIRAVGEAMEQMQGWLTATD